MQRLKILPVESKLFSVAFFWYCLQQLLGKIRIFLVVFFYSANILRKRANKMAPKRAANPEAVSLTTTVILTLLHRSSWQHSYQQEVKVPLLLYISQSEKWNKKVDYCCTWMFKTKLPPFKEGRKQEAKMLKELYDGDFYILGSTAPN